VFVGISLANPQICRDRIENMDAKALLKAHRKEILAIAARNGAVNVRVFGSVARGDNRPDSDIDFLVNLEPGRSLMDLARLLRELQTLLSTNVDVVTEAGLRARIKDEVLREAQPL
jgi:predicted nucleotidyltransferase